MAKILDWIKKHIWQTVLIGFGLFFLPLILVHVAYRIPAISPWFASTWEAGELITYIAGFEAFLGTVFLGIVAVHQNNKANQLNERMVKIQEDQGVFDRQPEFHVDAQTKYAKDIVDIYSMLKCTFASNTFFSQQEFETIKKEETYLFLFKLRNKSGFKVITSLHSLKLTNSEESFALEFETTPMIFKSYPLYIENETTEEVAFFVSHSDIKNISQVDGYMSLILVNPINERFCLEITFEIYGLAYMHIQILDYQIRRIDPFC